MRTAEIRKRWLDYFAKHNHHIADSVSLISPDPSILFTIAGMVPFTPYIIGTEKAPYPRVASVQKCIRTNDIDNVGRTTRHGTFFQMCGNFSFGDYFKEGALDLAFGLLTASIDDGGYGLEKDRLWVTIWDGDDVTFRYLTENIGLDAAHVVRLPREEIFWSTGQPGPAGPCAEIHYDRGPEFGPEAVGGTVDPGGDRYLEIWNIVFDQYLRGEGEGKNFPLLGELDQTAIDTGAGLERIAYLLQGKNNMYEIDEVYPIIEAVERITGKTYGDNENDDILMRVVADHVRSSMMLIADDVKPSNDGRGYVLRRLIRRAVRSVRLLGFHDHAYPELLPVAAQAMAESYPVLDKKFEEISTIAYREEQAFRRTLTAGTQIFEQAAQEAKKAGTGLPGEAAFTLHDTYGFPIDLTLEMAAEKGISVDEQGFRTLMQEQKDRARADAQSKKTGHVDATVYHEIQANGGDTHFLGYTDYAAEGKVVGILQDGVSVPTVEAPAQVDVILNQTPFWAEQGGQLADHGTISVAGGAIIKVNDVQMPIKGLYVHRGELTEGSVTLDDEVYSQIDVSRRKQIGRAHTATHMVHKALHEYLGPQATQAGSEDSPSRLRFDFHHGEQIPASTLQNIEARVNERLQDNLEVNAKLMNIEEAKASGAMALFGEKYGNEVRVISIGEDWSRELCTGTHVKSTGALGLVSILGESSIGSGIRRIEALVGEGAYAAGARERALLSQLSTLTHVRQEELPEHIDTLLNRLKNADKELASLRREKMLSQTSAIVEQRKDINGVSVVAHNLGDVASADDVRTVVLDVRERLGDQPAVVAMTGVAKERPTIVIATNEAARNNGLKAGALVGIAAKILGGGGGGKPDLAQGGGTDINQISAALDAVSQAIAQN